MSTPTAGEITVLRCVVHVVRRGGWSWGPDPHGLVRQVLDALPDLLAEHFEEVVTGEGPDVEITEPVRLSVRLGRSAWSGAGLASVGLVVEPTPGGLPVPAPVLASPVASTEDSVPTGHVVVEGTWRTPALLLGELAERGELTALLALLPDETLRVFLSALLGDPAEVPPAELISRLAEELTTRRSLATRPETYDDLVELVRSLPGAATEPTSWSQASEPSATAFSRAVGETRVCSALPFLLVGPLARTGYLDAIGPALSTVDLLDEAPLFAAALAYKVLGAPERGWRRTGEDHAAAAAFAGLDSVPDLTDFARRVRPALPVLDGVLALSLCRGHDAADPLLISGVDEGLLLVDAQGVFPIAWAPTVAGLLPYWEACGRPAVAVCDSPLPRSCLRELASAGVRLVTNVRPLRDDPLTRLPWRTPLWSSGDPDTRLAVALPAHAEHLDELVRTLFTAHRAAPRADGGLDRSTALAASLSLGLIAWTLWHERETPDPVLALTRFADLEATVEFGRDAVRVRLPLGRRHTDLWQNGVLTDVPDVVWLGGRTLTFSGG